MKTLTKRDYSILLGHTLDHFDSSLYGFLAPVLAPLFFPNHDPIVQLILIYSLTATSLITRPLGAFIFGMIARHQGPMRGLAYSLIGLAIGSVAIGCVPTYQTLGWIAPLVLIIMRMIKGVFAAGEGTIAKLSIMENKPKRQALIASHFYQSAPMLGMVLASALSFGIISFYPEAWRLCFWLGGFTGYAAYRLRCQGTLSLAPENTGFQAFQFSNLRSLWEYRSPAFAVVLATGLGHLTYGIPFVFMNTFIPFITSISLETMMAFNTALLILDMILIPLIGRFTLRYEGKTVMLVAGLILMLSFPPLFMALPNASLWYVLFVRIWIVFWGVVFLCPMNFWFKSLFPVREQYLLIGMSGALGAATLGRMTVPLCFWLWHQTGSPLWPSLYMALIPFAAMLSLYVQRKRIQLFT